MFRIKAFDAVRSTPENLVFGLHPKALVFEFDSTAYLLRFYRGKKEIFKQKAIER
jgi:hypothetical protein